MLEHSHDSEQQRRHPPVLAERPELVERRRLDHLYARAEGRLLRIVAPSGFGKTTIAARWVATDPRLVRWIDLHRGDDDPAELFRTLRNALTGIYDVPTPSTAHAVAVNPYLRALEEAVTGPPPSEPFVLVLDDVHRIRSSDGNWLIRTVVEHVTPGSTVVLIGRGHHDHGTLGRLRLAPGIVDVTVDDLAFDPSESHRLLESLGVDASAPDIHDVVELLEGWPAGVRLAGDVLRTSPVSTDISDHLALVDYLRDEWLDQLDDHDREFLRDVSLLGRFSGDVCDEVLERSGSQELLERLHRDHAVVFALDQRTRWYRLHGLLRHRLATELKDVDPRRWVEIHRRAATALEGLGDIDRAVEHLRAAGAMPELETLVTVHGGRFFTTGRDQMVERWLTAFAPQDVRASPGLTGLQCIKSLHRGDEMRAVQWMRLHDDAVRTRGGPGEEPATWWAPVLHGALDERPAGELIPGVAAARRQLAGGPWAGFACWVHGGLSFVDGDLDTARAALEAGVFEGELGGDELVVAHCFGTMSIIDDCVGDEASAALNAARAGEAAAHCGAVLLPPTAPVIAITALQSARHGDRAGAVRGIAAARNALRGFRGIAPWFNMVTRLALVRTVLVLDDRLTAHELLRELEYHARLEPDGNETVGGVIECLYELQVQVRAMHVPATGASGMTDSELRVLRLLPTNLSLADIASQLYVSRNTVKTHVASIYRKLDVDKRADAVERARSAGLIPSVAPG